MGNRLAASRSTLGGHRRTGRGRPGARGHHGLSGDNKKTPMRGRYLEVTFRKGRPVAAYLYLPRRGAEHAARVSKASPGLLIDFNPDGGATHQLDVAEYESRLQGVPPGATDSDAAPSPSYAVAPGVTCVVWRR
jgi:hypothetical protein